ncbi:MAG: trypsin-like peptidase domain-containing protein [Myxococcales bacterium]
MHRPRSRRRPRPWCASAPPPATGPVRSSLPPGSCSPTTTSWASTCARAKAASSRLTFGFQRGSSYEEPRPVFVTPVAVDVGLDLAVLQVRYQGQPLGTPDYLALKELDSESLLASTVYVVGHPKGHLKKWSVGTVVEARGEWFEFDAFSLPGSSGSPVLNAEGELVGLLHRGGNGAELVTGNGYDAYSIGTASGPLAAAMKAPLPSTMLSVNAPMTQADVVAHNEVFLNAGVDEAHVGEATLPILPMLGEACDAGLARTDLRSPEDLDAALAPCDAAMTWIECETDASAPIHATACPSMEERSAWTSRYWAMNQAWRDLTGELHLAAVSFGISSLQSSKREGVEEGARNLLLALEQADAPLDFNVASYLAAFQVSSYAGTELKTYVLEYSKVPGYDLFGTSIPSTALWLNSAHKLASQDLKDLLAKLSADPNVTIGTQLYVEDYRYRMGVLR